MFGTLVLASGRTVRVCGVLIEQTGIHVNAIGAWPQIAGRFQRAAADIRIAGARLANHVPLVLVDDWARYFAAPDVFEHPARTFDRWPDFAPPGEHPPRWVCVAWLGSTKLDVEDLGSHLVVGWFADAVTDLDAEIIAAASKVDWERHAAGHGI